MILPPVPRRVAAVAGRLPRGIAVTPALLVGALVAGLGLDQLLLWRFVDFAPWWLYLPGGAAIAGVALLAVRLAGRMDVPRPGVRRLAACIAVAFLLFLLGGEGRLFYANIDWQVRDAILHDVTIHPWPFAYTARGTPELLRAPLGMYLVPALVGKAAGPVAADLALLVRNSLMLGVTLALASVRFATTRSRLAALAIFLGFSGMDLLGQLLVDWGRGVPLPDHLEPWAQIQFSSHVTQAFWVPQHALSGWIPAVLFLLWKDQRLPVGLLLGALPLLALWSPLGVIGALPFAAYAGIRALAGREIGRSDVAFTVLATLIAAPGLLYMSAAGGSVGLRFFPVPMGRWLLFELIEILPYVTAVAAIGLRGRAGWATLAIVTACLLILPFWQIGESIDLMMRGSIPALAILSVLVADALRRVHGSGERRGWAVMLAVALAIGSVTGLAEIRRAITHRASPRPQCSFAGAWDRSFAGYGKSTYLAPLDSFARPIRPRAPTLLPPGDPPQCWDRPWMLPRGG